MVYPCCCSCLCCLSSIIDHWISSKYIYQLMLVYLCNWRASTQSSFWSMTFALLGNYGLFVSYPLTYVSYQLPLIPAYQANLSIGWCLFIYALVFAPLGDESFVWFLPIDHYISSQFIYWLMLVYATGGLLPDTGFLSLKLTPQVLSDSYRLACLLNYTKVFHKIKSSDYEIGSPNNGC